jgi:hypothetical protein
MKDKLKKWVPKIVKEVMCVAAVAVCAHLCSVVIGDPAIAMPLGILGGAYAMPQLKKLASKLPGLG